MNESDLLNLQLAASQQPKPYWPELEIANDIYVDAGEEDLKLTKVFADIAGIKTK